MGIKIDHWFVRDPAKLEGLSLLEERESAGEYTGKLARIYIDRVDTTPLSNGWTAVSLCINVSMPSGKVYTDVGRGVIGSDACDDNAAAASRATDLIEIWWSSVTDSGALRLWQAGEMTLDAVGDEFAAALKDTMGYDAIRDLVDDFRTHKHR